MAYAGLLTIRDITRLADPQVVPSGWTASAPREDRRVERGELLGRQVAERSCVPLERLALRSRRLRPLHERVGPRDPRIGGGNRERRRRGGSATRLVRRSVLRLRLPAG